MSRFTKDDPTETLALYDEHVARHPDIQRKGAKNPYTSANGHMFSFMNKDGEVGIRLSKEDQAAFIEEFDSKLFISYGATMRGYVTVPISLLESGAFQDYLTKSLEYVLSLPPKPTKKKK